MTALALNANPSGLRVFFGVTLCLLLGAGFYIWRNRKTFFSFSGDPGDSYASANLRMWLILLVWIHAVAVTTLMIFEI